MNKNVKITQFTISWVIFRFPTTEKRNAKIKKSYIFCFTINDTLYTTNVPWASPRGSLREGHARNKILPYLMQTPPNEPMTVNVETPCLRGALRLQNPYFDTNIPIHIIHPLDLVLLDFPSFFCLWFFLLCRCLPLFLHSNSYHSWQNLFCVTHIDYEEPIDLTVEDLRVSKII